MREVMWHKDNVPLCWGDEWEWWGLWHCDLAPPNLPGVDVAWCCQIFHFLNKSQKSLFSNLPKSIFKTSQFLNVGINSKDFENLGAS